jgi:hypothetical protein
MIALMKTALLATFLLGCSTNTTINEAAPTALLGDAEPEAAPPGPDDAGAADASSSREAGFDAGVEAAPGWCGLSPPSEVGFSNDCEAHALGSSSIECGACAEAAYVFVCGTPGLPRPLATDCFAGAVDGGMPVACCARPGCVRAEWVDYACKSAATPKGYACSPGADGGIVVAPPSPDCDLASSNAITPDNRPGWQYCCP